MFPAHLIPSGEACAPVNLTLIVNTTYTVGDSSSSGPIEQRNFVPMRITPACSFATVDPNNQKNLVGNGGIGGGGQYSNVSFSPLSMHGPMHSHPCHPTLSLLFAPTADASVNHNGRVVCPDQQLKDCFLDQLWREGGSLSAYTAN